MTRPTLALFRALQAAIEAEGRADLLAMLYTLSGFYISGRQLPQALLDAGREAAAVARMRAEGELALLEGRTR